MDTPLVESGEIKLVSKAFDLHPMLERLGMAFAPEAAGRGLAFKMDIGAKESIVTGDACRVEQILNNLLSNALKFTPSGAITLACTRKGDAYVFAVSDTGVGIKSEDMGKLFRPFSQVESGPTVIQDGIGLGLAISRRLAEAMGGSITAESEWNKGSRFTFTLPAGSSA